MSYLGEATGPVSTLSADLLSNVNMVDGMMMVQFGACVDINEDMVIIVKNMLLLEIN